MPTSLHGGTSGFNQRVCTAPPVTSADGGTLTLIYLSKDEEQGYASTLCVPVVYNTLTKSGGLRLVYTATTDKPTVLKLAHHSYFNLNYS